MPTGLPPGILTFTGPAVSISAFDWLAMLAVFQPATSGLRNGELRHIAALKRPSEGVDNLTYEHRIRQ